MPHKYIYQRKTNQIKSNIKCQMQLTYELENSSHAYILYFRYATHTHTVIFFTIVGLLLLSLIWTWWINCMLCKYVMCFPIYCVYTYCHSLARIFFLLHTEHNWISDNLHFLHIYMHFFIWKKKRKENCNRKCKQYV